MQIKSASGWGVLGVAGVGCLGWAGGGAVGVLAGWWVGGAPGVVGVGFDFGAEAGGRRGGDKGAPQGWVFGSPRTLRSSKTFTRTPMVFKKEGFRVQGLKEKEKTAPLVI